MNMSEFNESTFVEGLDKRKIENERNFRNQ